jgi:ferritin-like protein
MGRAGREVIGDTMHSVIEDLNRAAAAELQDAFRYQLLAKMAQGMNAPEVASWFQNTAQDEWAHLGQLVERIVSLGGRPLTRPEQAANLTYAPYLEPPEDPTDLRQMISDSLQGERAAIRFYTDLYRKTQHTDPVTAALAQQMIADEVSDEDDLERFLA